MMPACDAFSRPRNHIADLVMIKDVCRCVLRVAHHVGRADHHRVIGLRSVLQRGADYGHG